jgi:acyl-CoA synthetase (AMP-forming)/AMP-acid ligase II
MFASDGIDFTALYLGAMRMGAVPVPVSTMLRADGLAELLQRISSSAGTERAEASARWEGQAWPSARAHSHVLLALPSGSFPGVDEADVFEFLERHSSD